MSQWSIAIIIQIIGHTKWEPPKKMMKCKTEHIQRSMSYENDFKISRDLIEFVESKHYLLIENMIIIEIIFDPNINNDIIIGANRSKWWALPQQMFSMVWSIFYNLFINMFLCDH